MKIAFIRAAWVRGSTAVPPALLTPLLAATLAFTGGHAMANDAIAGKAKAQACTVCHGPLGVSSMPDTPHLAGQPAIYLKAQLRAYRSGVRKHEVMAVMAKPLSDDDINLLAAWYASISIEAKAAP